MATQPEIVKQGDMLNQLVFNLNTMQELGSVDVLWMHPPVHRVLGFICKSGFLGTQKTAFNLAQIKSLGTSGILVNAKPVETDSEKVRKLESLIGSEIWSNAGDKIGRITDCLFNLRTGAITEYLFASSGWSGITGAVYLLPPSQILSFGNKRVLVSEVEDFAVYREGIKQKLTKAGTQATQELRSLREQAKERAQALAEQAKEKVQTLSEQLTEETQTLAKQSKEKGQVLIEQVREQAYTIGEQVKEKLDPVVEKKLNTPSSAPTKDPTETVPEDDDEPWI